MCYTNDLLLLSPARKYIRKKMKEEDLPDLLDDKEWYILSPGKHGSISPRSFLLRTGEIVKGIRCDDKETTVRWVKVYGDTYLGVGVFHA